MKMFHEADLIAMPACTEGFGVKQFQPVCLCLSLVNSRMDGGMSVVVSSNSPEEQELTFLILIVKQNGNLFFLWDFLGFVFRALTK